MEGNVRRVRKTNKVAHNTVISGGIRPMLDIALEKDLIELLATNFKAAQIEELGKLLFGNFDIYKLLNEQNHITIPARRAAQLLVQHCSECNCHPKLIHLLVETDGSQFMGRQANVEGIELFLDKLTGSGLAYDFSRRQVIKIKDDPFELMNWGSLRNGRSYPLTVLSLDVVGSSALSRSHGARKVGKALFQLAQHVKDRLRPYDGRIWNWNGDGGIIAFAFKEHEVRAVQFALELQLTMPVLNTRMELPDKVDLALRAGLDSGKLTFANDVGAIVSDVINYACHLEKSAVPAGSIGLSKTLHACLPARLAAPFSKRITFQDREAVLIPGRIDNLYHRPDGTDNEPELMGRIAAG
ncbi:MAG: adenylate/guanylate cyclase domain-containing protein [Spirochaetaceae bacterium]|nr:MAG: adenylate/guanylate cyclase domain-containing protein [Spirochaetaceae bacterium]